MGRGGLQFMLDPLAPRDLVAVARLLVRADSSLVGDLPSSDVDRVPSFRAYIGKVVGPTRAARLLRRGNGPCCSSFFALLALPVNFSYAWFALLALVNGIGVGMFAAPNTTTMMNAVPADQRGVASGMRATFMNSGFVLSIGIFFSLMIVGLAARLPATLSKGLVAQGVPVSVAHHVAGLPPVGTLFAAFLGFNPMKTLLGSHVLAGVGPAHAATLTGKTFFPKSHLRTRSTLVL